MERSYDLLQEFEGLAEPEGFLELLRELKESMFFYDRDVLVAMAATILEGITASILLAAAIEGRPALDAADQRIRSSLRQMPSLLRQGRFPMDVTAVLLRFTERGLPAVEAAYEAAHATYASWERGQAPPADPERCLYRARLAMDRGDDEEGLRWIGAAGRAVLAGYRIRPVWLQIAGRMAGHVNGLFIVRDTLVTHPFAAYPLLSVAEERARQQAQFKVYDLAHIRRLRQAADEEAAVGAGPALDEVDLMWESILSDGPVVRPEDFTLLRQLGGQALYPLLTIVRARELRRAKAVFVALHQLRRSRARETFLAVVSLLEEVSPDDPLFSEGLKVLAAAGPRCKDPLLDYLERETNPRKRVLCADLVARFRGEERALRWLLDTFAQTGWHEGKEEIAESLARYGDVRAVPVLRAALSGDDRRDWRLESALRTLVARGGHGEALGKGG